MVTTQPAPVNTVPPGVALPYRLSIGNPSTGASIVETIVMEGTGADVLDAGFAGHQRGSALLGEENGRCMVLFGDRTLHGGVFRHLDQITTSTFAQLQAADASSPLYLYQATTRAIVPATTDAVAAEIARVHTLAEGGRSPDLVLVANSRADFTPTDTRFYIVVSFNFNVCPLGC